MMRRLIIVGVVLALIGAACSDDTDDTTAGADGATTAATTGTGTAPPPDTTPPETAPSITSEEPFIFEGDFSAFVAALQFFLLCNEYDATAIDGIFGEQTTVAVRLAQVDLGYRETGEPTRSMFAELARTCDRGRSFFFPPGETVTQSAGYAAPDHEDDIGLGATAGQRFMLATVGGDPVTITLLSPDGSVVEPVPVGGASVTLPATGMYTVRVSADEPAWFLLTATLTGEGQNVDVSSIVLDADEIGGLGLVDLMESADDVIEIMNAKLGPPSHDTGDDTETGCPGVHREVMWSIPAPDGGVPSLLTLHFHDDDGRWPEMRFTDWAYWPAESDGSMPTRPGLLTTPRGITIGSTTSDAIVAYPELEFGMNALSGDVMGWTGDFEMIINAFFDGAIDMTTDFGQLDGYVTGIRLPLDNCPDELAS